MTNGVARAKFYKKEIVVLSTYFYAIELFCLVLQTFRVGLIGFLTFQSPLQMTTQLLVTKYLHIK